MTSATARCPRPRCCRSDGRRRCGAPPDVPLDDCREVVDRALAALEARPTPTTTPVLDVVGTMLADRSMVRVAQVEAASGLGTRSLQRLFARYVGVSPKWVLARYRMHDVVTALDEGYDGSLAELAARHGWFDQAHFTREFTTLVGVPSGRVPPPRLGSYP